MNILQRDVSLYNKESYKYYNGFNIYSLTVKADFTYFILFLLISLFGYNNFSSFYNDLSLIMAYTYYLYVYYVYILNNKSFILSSTYTISSLLTCKINGLFD